MVKASTLYFVIVVSLIIAILTSSFIAAAFFYRAEIQKADRRAKLQDNLQSGIAILLSLSHNSYDTGVKISLFDSQDDSVFIRKERWGVFTIGSARSFIQTDSIQSAFLIGLATGSDQSALYLTDENRPLSISGDTRITGVAELPASGIRNSYVNGRPYSGKKLVEGTITKSKRSLSPLQKEVLDELRSYISQDRLRMPERDSVVNSFHNERLIISPGSELRAKVLQGKILIISDTILTIRKSTVLQDVIIYAPAIIVEEGFRGNCQLFATDSVIIGKNSRFSYPTCIGVFRKQDADLQPKLSIGDSTEVTGILFTHEDVQTPLQTLISLGKNARMIGEIHGGIVKMNGKLEIQGKVSSNRFIFQTSTTLFENYLVDIVINRVKRTKYYLSSELFGRAKEERRILKWLN